MLNIEKINKKLNKEYGNLVKVHVNSDNHSIVVEGELESWDDIVKACNMSVYNKEGYHVVNKIKLKGVKIPEIKKPLIKDNSLDGESYDVVIIGGGISGCSIARELSKWDIKILLVDKEADLANGASSRNDGEVHPGVDQKHHNLKLKYELLGNKMYEDVCKDLDVPFKRNGQYVAFKGKYLKPILEIACLSKRMLGVKDTKVVSKKELYEAIPHLKEGYDYAIFNPTAGNVCPYGLTIAYAENAVKNGAKVSLNTIVESMDVKDGIIKSIKTNRGTIYPKVVVNAAGVYADEIANMANDQFFSIHPRRGTDAILDNKVSNLTSKIVSYREIINKEKNTKGGGVMQTVHENILIGPNAKETYEKENYATHSEDIEWLFNKQRKTIPELSERDIITYFTGVRAPSFEEDFIIENGRSTKNIIHDAAIQSPGLTAAPAIALDIEKMVIEMLGNVKRNKNYDPTRKGIPSLKNMPDDKRAELIKQNPDYGVIICRCEEISMGEIKDCLKSNIVVPTIDGIKRRVRPGMGRCQGGFCSPLVSKIIAEYQNKEIKDITKNGDGSYVTLGKTK